MRITRRGLGRSLAAALVLALVPAGAAHAAQASPRIVGGSATGNPGWIALVNVDFPDGSGALCTGELIAKSWVLTAAHCVADQNTDTTVAAAGVHVWVGVNRQSQATAGNVQAVDRVVVDPDHSFISSFGDLAALHLTALDGHDPVALGGPADPAVGSAATTLGFGVTNSLLPLPSDALQQVAANILDPSQCGGYGSSFDAPTMICAGGVPGQDSCEGDSGGPLAAAATSPVATLLGTVDYGSNFCGDGSAAVYQRVTGGAGAAWLAGLVPTVSITPSSASPAKNTTITATASATNLPGAAFSWDLNGDGVYGDATGAGVRIPLGSSPQALGVRAAGQGGDGAARRITVTPVDTQVTVTAPSRVTEGGRLKLRITTSGPATGTLTATATGRGVSVSGTAALPGASTLVLRMPDDKVWKAPHRVNVALVVTQGLALTTAKLKTTLVDNDRPKIRITSAHRSGARRVSVVAKAPAAGTFTVRIVRTGRTLARRTAKVRGTAPRTVSVPLSAAAAQAVAKGGATARVAWRSSTTPVAKASASRAVR